MHEGIKQPQGISPENIEVLRKLLESLRTKWREQGVTLQARYGSHKRHGDHIYLATLEKNKNLKEKKTVKDSKLWLNFAR